MKIRKFYPAQVMRKLNGQVVSTLTAPNLAALDIGVRRARKAGVVVTVVEGVIYVHSAKQVGQMIMADLKETLPKLYQKGRELGFVVTPSQLNA